jgi:arginyl-tRNA synthetase
VVVNLDNILIYTKTMDEHRKLVTQVFSILQKEGLAVATHKSFFYVKEVKFLGYMFNANGVKMSTRKVEAVRLWEMPKNLKDIQKFLGFANLYRKFLTKVFAAGTTHYGPYMKQRSRFSLGTHAGVSVSTAKRCVDFNTHLEAF